MSSHCALFRREELDRFGKKHFQRTTVPGKEDWTFWIVVAVGAPCIVQVLKLRFDSMNHNSSVQGDLIFDVGMHRGDDTDFYLKKGFRVVGIEANPELAQLCRQRFTEAIAQGLLNVEEGAISEEKVSVPFYVNLQKDDWSATDVAIAGRQGMEVRELIVCSLRLDDLLAKHGVPYYIKIDIEGGDRLALSQLARYQHRPKYCSVEAHDLAYLVRLLDLRYTECKVVNQANYWWFTCPHNRPAISPTESVG